ncbi:MAG: hypothetical protein SGJ27_31105 [Candidatus Melainabacteria bacterium]|nr:hypothetical protein [Candidatus Melainabacteria bacterium]
MDHGPQKATIMQISFVPLFETTSCDGFLPAQSVAIIETLLRRPNLRFDGKIYLQRDQHGHGLLHTVQIFFPSPFIPRNDWFINLQWQMRTGCKGSVLTPGKPYVRAAMEGQAPDLIHQLTEELIAGFNADGGTTVLTQVMLSEYLKWWRIEHRDDPSTTSTGERLAIRAQINWG